MVPNWIFDEGIYLDMYETMILMYMIRLVNKKDNTIGKEDTLFLSAEQLANCCNYSIGKAKKVLKRLQELGYIRKQFNRKG